MTDNPYSGPILPTVAQPRKRSFLSGCGGIIAIIGIGLVLLVLLMPFSRGREAPRRTQCKNNLKQIGLAFHNYHDDHGVFPPAYTVDENGTRLHSWRTLILPYLVSVLKVASRGNRMASDLLKNPEQFVLGIACKIKTALNGDFWCILGVFIRSARTFPAERHQKLRL